jgi:hypothetical protein
VPGIIFRGCIAETPRKVFRCSGFAAPTCRTGKPLLSRPSSVWQGSDLHGFAKPISRNDINVSRDFNLLHLNAASPKLEFRDPDFARAIPRNCGALKNSSW